MNLEGGEGSRTRRNNSDDSFDSRFCGVVSEWRSSAKAAHRPQGAYPASSSRRSMPENGRPSATSSFAATMIREGNGVKIFKETVNVAAEVRGCLRQDQGKTTIYRLLKTSPYRCQSMNCALENYRTCALDRSSQPEKPYYSHSRRFRMLPFFHLHVALRCDPGSVPQAQTGYSIQLIQKRPQDPNMDGTGLRLRTMEHGGE
jgi:hypothetical protein